MRLFDLHCDTLARGVRQQTPFDPWVQTYAAFIPDGMSSTDASAHYERLTTLYRQWRDDPSCDHTTLLSVENGGMLSFCESVFDRMAADGVVMAGLTWNGDNPWGGGCHSACGELTVDGLRAVRELQRRNITVDVSHLSERGFWQVDAIATAPYVASHSNAAAVTPHPRNLTDEQFIAIRDRGGVVGLTVYPPFIGNHSPQAFCYHAEHFWSLGGEKTVCIGSDIDGFDMPPVTASYLAEIYEYMTAQRYPSSLIEDLFYNNAYRFFFGAQDRKEEKL